jgi:hypothetical protein
VLRCPVVLLQATLLPSPSPLLQEPLLQAVLLPADLLPAHLLPAEVLPDEVLPSPSSLLPADLLPAHVLCGGPELRLRRLSTVRGASASFQAVSLTVEQTAPRVERAGRLFFWRLFVEIQPFPAISVPRHPRSLPAPLPGWQTLQWVLLATRPVS